MSLRAEMLPLPSSAGRPPRLWARARGELRNLASEVPSRLDRGLARRQLSRWSLRAKPARVPRAEGCGETGFFSARHSLRQAATA